MISINESIPEAELWGISSFILIHDVNIFGLSQYMIQPIYGYILHQSIFFINNKNGLATVFNP